MSDFKRRDKVENRKLKRVNFLKEKKEKQKEKEREEKRKVFDFLELQSLKLLSELAIVKSKRKHSNYRNLELNRLKKDLEIKLKMLQKHEQILKNCHSRFVAASRKVPGKLRQTVAMPLNCGSQLCHRCSKSKSTVHRRKTRRVARWLLELKANDGTKPSLHNYVLTVPVELRHFFCGKSMLDKLFRTANDAVMKFVPAVGSVCTLHAFGDRGKGWNPHVNVQYAGLDGNGNRIPNFYSQEKMKAIREEFLKRVLLFIPKEILKTLPANYVETNANGNRNFRVKKGQKLHSILYQTRGTVNVDELQNEPQKVIDLFLYSLAPCKIDGAENTTMSGKGKGYRWIRYFGKYACGNRQRLLEENGILFANNKPFAVTDFPDVEFEIVTIGGKPKMFSFWEHVPLGTHKELNLPLVDLDYVFDDDFESAATVNV